MGRLAWMPVLLAYAVASLHKGDSARSSPKGDVYMGSSGNAGTPK